MESDNSVFITVTGRVQGVGFRYSTLKMARALNLKGYVKNMTDGSVFIVAQGTPDAVGKLIGWCRSGPPRAIVESVEHSAHPAVGYDNFQVR